MIGIYYVLLLLAQANSTKFKGPNFQRQNLLYCILILNMLLFIDYTSIIGRY